ncbi:hypothetical protein B0H66DRAFT_533777 [Apodospora peruviana]|uniref:Uncharacterized protein n=1 Tax=Apodospora peruviana TaxID=516989 RepID=A0AAE0M4S7_9PEZI|nr:hypothetical protein B0H66DRAFT_533777 [Apodospora peruviana]
MAKEDPGLPLHRGSPAKKQEQFALPEIKNRGILVLVLVCIHAITSSILALPLAGLLWFTIPNFEGLFVKVYQVLYSTGIWADVLCIVYLRIRVRKARGMGEPPKPCTTISDAIKLPGWKPLALYYMWIWDMYFTFLERHPLRRPCPSPKKDTTMKRCCIQSLFVCLAYVFCVLIVGAFVSIFILLKWWDPLVMDIAGNEPVPWWLAGLWTTMAVAVIGLLGELGILCLVYLRTHDDGFRLRSPPCVFEVEQGDALNVYLIVAFYVLGLSKGLLKKACRWDGDKPL